MNIIKKQAEWHGGHAYLENVSYLLSGWVDMAKGGIEICEEYDGFVNISDANPATITPNTEAWEAWKATLPDPTLEVKAQKIAQSKTDLAAYLLAHPLQWTDGEYYAITAEKQAQLTSKIMAATMAQTLSQPYDLKWNSTGDVCKAWTLADLSALAFAIDARVTSLVTYQQQKEVEIRNCETVEAVNAVVVDYDTVQ